MKNLVLVLIVLLVACSKSPKPISEPSGKMLITTNRDGNYELYSMQADGSNPMNLTQSESLEFGGSWHPDGNSIVTYSDRDGNNEIYHIDISTGSAIRLTDHESSDVLPTFSPDGSQILFMSERNGSSRDLFIMNADGTNKRALTNNELYEESPAWSPDGSKIAFTRLIKEQVDTTLVSNGEIFIMNADGSKVQRLTQKAGYDSGAAFSPDGSQIAFYGMANESFDLFIMNADGSNLYNLTNDSLEAYSPSWSPDGEWIAYTGGNRENYDIYLIHVDTGERRRITTTEGRDENAKWYYKKTSD